MALGCTRPYLTQLVREEFFEELSNGQLLNKKVTARISLRERGRCLYLIIYLAIDFDNLRNTKINLYKVKK
jgi:hypothetical protein